jgi:hypothetical protein
VLPPGCNRAGNRATTPGPDSEVIGNGTTAGGSHAARNGLAHPSPVDTAGWDKIMHDELTIARELPVPVQGPAATTEASIIKYDYLAFARATS